MKMIAKNTVYGVTVVERAVGDIGKQADIAYPGDTFETAEIIGAKLATGGFASKLGDTEVVVEKPKGRKSKVVDDDMDI